MKKEELKAGIECAYQTRRSLDCPLQHIRLIERVRGKWKAEWINPNPGLIAYASSRLIVTTWEDHEGFLRDKASLAHLTEYSQALGSILESPVRLAIEEAFKSTGESADCDKGILSLSSESLNRILARVGLAKYELKPPAYTDRKGDVHLPMDQAKELGRSFCRAEPSSVLMYIDATERQWSSKLSGLGGEYDYVVSGLISYRSAWALLHQWCGKDACIAAPEKQIDTLVQLLREAIGTLQKVGANEEAARLLNVLEHG